jgi:hypothetical protein
MLGLIGGGFAQFHPFTQQRAELPQKHRNEGTVK